MDIERLGSYFFITGALIAIFSGSFPVNPGMEVIVLLTLIITGGFVGLLNIQEEREIHFLIAVGVFIISTTAIDHYLIQLELFKNFADILTSFIIFSATAAIVVALKLIFHYAGTREEYNDPPEFKDPKKEQAWNQTIFIAVCFAFIIFVVEAFYYTNGLHPFFIYLSWLVIIVFTIDAVILYRKSKNLTHFIKHHWIDVVAIIPFSGMFQLAKIARFARMARVFTRTSKLTRVSKISHSSKFFSKHSGFNKIIEKKK